MTDGTVLFGTGQVGGNVVVFKLDLFGTAPITSVQGMPGSSRGIARHPDGRLVIAGFNGSTGFLARYFTDLTPDPAFGSSGLATMVGDVFHDVAIDSSGRYVAAGKRGSMALVARFLGDGSRDPSFGTNGAFVLPALSAQMEAVLVDPHGRIVTVGSMNDATGSHMLLLRLE